MPILSGRRALLEILKQEGIEILFGNPGTTELPLMDALASETELRFVLGLQEAAVIGMADGYAQASGRLTFVNLHVTPGLGNAMGMLYDAQKAGSPLLVTAGQHDQSFTATEPILWADLPPIARPLVKWASEIHRLADLPRLVHRAAKTALASPTGPVFLSLPADVLIEEAELDLGAPTRIANGFRADPQAIEAAAMLLAQAARPVLIAGDAVMQSRAHAELIHIAELLGAPVYLESVPSTVSFPASHPLYKGTIARLGPAIRAVLDRHDLLFSVGGDLFTTSLPYDIEPVPPNYPIIHLDTDPWELGKNYPTKVALFGNPKTSLADLALALDAAMTGAQRDDAATRRDACAAAIRGEREKLTARARAGNDTVPILPLSLLHAIGEMLPPEAVVVEETLSSGVALRELVPRDDYQGFFGMRGGGIGWGLPAAIGVKLALPDRPVVALIGDGSAMYTIQALWTAAHQRLGIVFVILNNASYRILKQRVHAMRGIAAQTDRYVGMDLVDPRIDFVGLARSLGVAAERATRVSEVCALIRQGIDSAAPLLIDAAIDPSFKPV